MASKKRPPFPKSAILGDGGGVVELAVRAERISPYHRLGRRSNDAFGSLVKGCFVRLSRLQYICDIEGSQRGDASTSEMKGAVAFRLQLASMGEGDRKG